MPSKVAYSLIQCSKLISTTFPNGLTSIGGGVFNSWLSLTTISISTSVTFIGEGAFAACFNVITNDVEDRNSIFDLCNNCNAIIRTFRYKLTEKH